MLSLFARLAVIASCISSPAVAAEITRHPNDSATLNAVYFKGPIVLGDAMKLKEYVKALPKKNATAIYLNSTGGVVSEAVSIGYFFRAQGIRTVIEGAGGQCLSACAFAFLGGFDESTQRPWRTKSSSSKLAFHAPFPKLKKASYSAEEVSGLLGNGNNAASELVTYFGEVHADYSLLRYAFRMRPSQFYEVSNDQALEIGINVYDEASKKMRYSEAAKAY